MKKCKTCKSSLKYNLCSNMKCKVWKDYKKSAINWCSAERGLTANDPIEVRCPTCNTIAGTMAQRMGCNGKCDKCNYIGSFPFPAFITGKYYLRRALSIQGVYRYDGAGQWSKV